MAVGYNENGTESSEKLFRSCVAPSGFAAPTGVGTSSSITISWSEPTSLGGCPITGYAVYRNGGDQTDPTTEVNSDYDTNIRDNPHLRQAVITSFPASSEGSTFLFKVEAITEDSGSLSPALSIKLAGPPADPTTAPKNVSEGTDTTQIQVTLDAISDNGNDPIVSYNLQMDDGSGGDFINLSGYTSNSLQLEHIITQGIRRGAGYRFRYRARNSAGWSNFSPIATIIASTYPLPPPAPTLYSSSATIIKLNLFDTEDNRGEAITTFELWMNGGTGSAVFTRIAEWASAPVTFEVTNDTHGIVSGQIYTFYTRTRNMVDYSNSSAEVRFAAARTPLTMSMPTKVQTGSNTTQITVKWDAATDTEVETTSYKLYAAEGNEEYQLIYDANLNTLLREFTYTGLTPGQLYSFRITSVNMNGEGTRSNPLDVYACSAPSQPEPPQLVSSTTESILLSWTPPASDGGCALVGYSLLTDSGSGGDVETQVDTNLNTNPQTLIKNATFSSSETGSWIRFKIMANNSEDGTSSRIVQYMPAVVPDKPANPPAKVDAETDDTQIAVSYSMATSENGGTSIIGYEVQIDDGNYGEYITVQGGEDKRTLATKAIISTGVQKGVTYRVRFRGINTVGKGEWSDPTSVLSSTVPGRPNALIISAFSNTGITLGITPITDDGGETITRYELFYSSSAVSLATFNNDTSFDWSTSSYAFNTVTTGLIYGFKIRAVNSKGDGSFSDVVYAAAGRAPETPTAPTYQATDSNRTHVTVQWIDGTSQDIAILGYRLSIDNMGNEEYTVIYDGDGSPNIQRFTYGPIETGETYNFILEVLNFNGPSSPSTALSVRVCDIPSGFDSLYKLSASSTNIKVAWRPPTDCGG